MHTQARLLAIARNMLAIATTTEMKNFSEGMSEDVHSKFAEGGKLGNCNYFEIIINKSNGVGCDHHSTGYDLLLKNFFVVSMI